MGKSFLQTKKWGEFQKTLGADYLNIGDFLVMKYGLPFGKNYLYIPRSNKQNYPEILNQVQSLFSTRLGNDVDDVVSPPLNLFRMQLRKGGAGGGRHPELDSGSPFRNTVFLRIEPEIESIDEGFIKKIKELGFKKVNQEGQPSKTIVLDLEKSEEEILKNMHSKTRYNIRLAEKKGVKVEMKDSLSEGEIEDVWKLIEMTSKRDKFQSFTKNYYEKLLSVFSGNSEGPILKIFLAKKDGQIIAVSITMFCDNAVYYLHGASDYEFRNLMAPYLVQWSAIQEAKQKGFLRYDFWGIDEKKWPGVTRFKRGFGGGEVEYAGTYDYAVKRFWYWGYNIGRSLRMFL